MTGLTTKMVLASAAVAAALVGGAMPAAAGTPSGHAAPTHYYLDCAAGNDSNAGTSTGTAWKTLAKVSAQTFSAGQTISIKDGTTCNGTLTLQGSGTASSPITLNSYGSGNQPKLVAANARATIYLHNVQGWEIHNLNVSDPGTDTTDPRAGIYVENTDYGVGSHYVFEGNTVQNVDGCDCTSPGQPGGGIVFNADGSNTITSFNGITVADNIVTGVSGEAIGTSSMWARRYNFPAGYGTGYGPNTNVLVQDNVLTNLGGDAIDIQNGKNALVQYNVVNGFGLKPTTDHAGIWSWDSDSTVMQYNVITGGNSMPHAAFAFDVDGADNNDTYQYNYTANNSGMMLICSVDGMPSANPVIRYNISQNDKADFGGVMILACAQQTGISIYDNDVYAPGVSSLLTNVSENLADTPSVSNNIFVGQSSGSTITDTVGTYSNNLYQNITSHPTDPKAVTGDPKFAAPGGSQGTDGYELDCGSPAIGAGAVIPNNGGQDFFGNKVPASKPNIGAFQGPCVN